MHEQGKMNQMMFEQMQQLNAQLAGLAAHNKMIENQLSQQGGTIPVPRGSLPSQPEPNPKGEAKAIKLRSGTEYTGPVMPEPEPVYTDRASDARTEQPNLTAGTTPIPEETNEYTDQAYSTRPVQGEKQNQKKKGTDTPPPYRPPVPFPQRLAKAKLDEQFGKFIQVLKQLHITIPFTEALTQMPTYAKFLKDILSNKRSLEGCETVKLTEQCSAIIRNELPPKLEDPGKFSIPCTIGKASIKRALCDLGASVSLMPRTIYDRIGVGELKPTRMTLQLADSSVRLPLGVVEDVPVQVGKFFVPGDFVVMEMEEDKEVPIILGRSFLRTAGALIDVKNGTLTLRIGDEKVQFQINRAMKYPDQLETCYRVDVIEEVMEELVEEQLLEQYDSSLKNYSMFLSEFQEELYEKEEVFTADTVAASTGEQVLDPDKSCSARAPLSEKLTAEDVHGPSRGPVRAAQVRAETSSNQSPI